MQCSKLRVTLAGLFIQYTCSSPHKLKYVMSQSHVSSYGDKHGQNHLMKFISNVKKRVLNEVASECDFWVVFLFTFININF